jgi:hypothetical protein
MDFNKLHSILESGTKEELTEFCHNNNLVIKDGKIFHSDTESVKQSVAFWDKRQLVKKINLNS